MSENLDTYVTLMREIEKLNRRVDDLAAPEIGGLPLIEYWEATGATASKTFPTSGTLPTHFNHLVITTTGRSTRVATVDDVGFQFNADAGARYHWGYMQRFAAAFGSGEFRGHNSLRIGICEAANAAANFHSPFFVIVFNYNRSAPSHYAMGWSTVWQANAAVADFGLTFRGGIWQPAASTAITSLTVLCNAGNMDTGFKITVRGMF